MMEKYICGHSTPESEILKELDRATHLNVVQPRMISGHIQGHFLKIITEMIRPQSVLEIGTFTGYSTICIASGLGDDGKITTIDPNDELLHISKEFFSRSGFSERIEVVTGDALIEIPKFDRTFDLVFIDGDKREYPDYYKLLMGDCGNAAVVKKGSYIIADNILWYGKVAEEIPQNDLYTKKIDEFNKIVLADSRVENLILPLRDGLNIIKVL